MIRGQGLTIIIDLLCEVDYDWNDTVFALFRANSPPLPPRASERALDIRIKAPSGHASADKPSASDTIPDMNSLAAVSESRIR